MIQIKGNPENARCLGAEARRCWFGQTTVVQKHYHGGSEPSHGNIMAGGGFRNVRRVKMLLSAQLNGGVGSSLLCQAERGFRSIFCFTREGRRAMNSYR